MTYYTPISTPIPAVNQQFAETQTSSNLIPIAYNYPPGYGYNNQYPYYSYDYSYYYQTPQSYVSGQNNTFDPVPVSTSVVPAQLSILPVQPTVPAIQSSSVPIQQIVAPNQASVLPFQSSITPIQPPVLPFRKSPVNHSYSYSYQPRKVEDRRSSSSSSEGSRTPLRRRSLDYGAFNPDKIKEPIENKRTFLPETFNTVVKEYSDTKQENIPTFEPDNRNSNRENKPNNIADDLTNNYNIKQIANLGRKVLTKKFNRFYKNLQASATTDF